VKRLTGTPPRRQKRLRPCDLPRARRPYRDRGEHLLSSARALRDERLDELLDESLREHGAIKDRMQEARASLDEPDRLRATMSSLQECVDHHVREEEREMFPRIVARMPEGERDELGRALATRKRAAMPAPRAKRTVKRAAARTTTTPRRRVRKTTAKAKKPRTAAKARGPPPLTARRPRTDRSSED
jgi:hypothetical protein